MPSTVSKVATQTSKSHAGGRSIFLLENRIDCRKVPCGASDVLQALDVKAGWFVMKVAVKVETAEGGAAVGDVGDGADADGFIVDADLNALGMTASALSLTEATPNTTTGYSNGKLYAADDTIDVVPSAALDAAVFVVRALVVDFNGLI